MRSWRRETGKIVGVGGATSVFNPVWSGKEGEEEVEQEGGREKVVLIKPLSPHQQAGRPITSRRLSP